MSFSIKQVKAILSTHNIPVDELDRCAEELCSRHTADLDSIKEERDGFKKDAETLASVQKELEDLKAAQAGGNAFEVKYNALKEEFDQYKADVANKETAAKTRDAYKALLKETGVSEKRVDAVLKVTDLSSVKLDAEGKIEGAEELAKSIKTEWADFITTNGKTGAETANPPANDGNSFKDLPLADKMKYANEHPTDAAVREWLNKK